MDFHVDMSFTAKPGEKKTEIDPTGSAQEHQVSSVSQVHISLLPLSEHELHLNPLV